MSVIRLPHIGKSFSAKRFFVGLKEFERFPEVVRLFFF